MVSGVGERSKHSDGVARQLPITNRAHKARIVGNARMSAVLATFDVATERCRATNLDRRHDAALSEAYMAGIGRAPCLTVATEDVRHLQLWF